MTMIVMVIMMRMMMVTMRKATQLTYTVGEKKIALKIWSFGINNFPLHHPRVSHIRRPPSFILPPSFFLP